MTHEKFLLGAANGDVNIVRDALKGKKIDPTVVDKSFKVAHQVIITSAKSDGMNALQFACANNQTQVIDLLLEDEEGRKTLNQQDLYKETALHIVARKTDSVDLVQKLLKAGANRIIRNVNDSTPLMRAVGQGDKAVVEMFLKHTMNQLMEVLQLFLSKDTSGMVCGYYGPISVPDINLTDNFQETPLHIALIWSTIAQHKDWFGIVKLLLEFEADPLHKAPYSEDTLLDFARKNKIAPGIVKLLEDNVKQKEEAKKKESDKKLDAKE